MPLTGWIGKMQYPWRFLSITQLLLSLLLCMLLVKFSKEKREHAELALMILLIITTGQMFSGTVEGYKYETKYDGAELDSFAILGCEYVRAGTEVQDFDGKVHTNNAEITENYTKQGKYAIIKCTVADTEDEAWVEFPIMNYKNYIAYGENGNRLNIVDGDNNVVRFMLPSSYSGIVAVTYEILSSYRVADVCSLTAVAVIAMAAILFRKKYNVRKT